MQTVVVMGKGDLAIKVADWFLHSEKHKLVAIVPVMPEPAWTQSLASWGRANGVPVIDSGHYKDLPRISAADGGIDRNVGVL